MVSWQGNVRRIKTKRLIKTGFQVRKINIYIYMRSEKTLTDKLAISLY